MSISVQNVSRRFGTFTALNDVSITMPDGELVALLGPSGSGKTTLLRIIAGLEIADSGSVTLHGIDATNHTPQERRVGFVFQHYALFRHLTVLENVAFGLRVRPKAERPSDDEIRKRCMQLLELVQLAPFAQHRPAQLSGGQRQRVALARALAIEPRVLLLDEPFGALDAQVRRELRRWLRDLHDRLGMTSIFVTHDQEEALEVADRVVVFNKGRIEQSGTPEEIYDHPVSTFVHRFIGEANVLRGQAQNGVAHFGNIAVPIAIPDGPVEGFWRPHQTIIHRTEIAGKCFPATIRHIVRLGPIVEISLDLEQPSGPAEAHLTSGQFAENRDLTVGTKVHIEPGGLRVFAGQVAH